MGSSSSDGAWLIVAELLPEIPRDRAQPRQLVVFVGGGLVLRVRDTRHVVQNGNRATALRRIEIQRVISARISGSDWGRVPNEEGSLNLTGCRVCLSETNVNAADGNMSGIDKDES
jgi:hypothetical protein